MVTSLECKQCAAPLPSPGGESAFVVCSYCGTTHTVAPPAIKLEPASSGPTDYERIRADADIAWDAAMAHSNDPVVAVRAIVAVHARKLKDEQEAERAARLAESLHKSFDTQHGTQTLHDKSAVIRMAESVVKALIELRTCESTEINLPFFTAKDGGPLHLLHVVKRKDLAVLDNMGVHQVKELPAETAPPHEEAAEEAAIPNEVPRKRLLGPVLVVVVLLAGGLAFFLAR